MVVNYKKQWKRKKSLNYKAWKKRNIMNVCHACKYIGCMLFACMCLYACVLCILVKTVCAFKEKSLSGSFEIRWDESSMEHVSMCPSRAEIGKCQSQMETCLDLEAYQFPPRLCPQGWVRFGPCRHHCPVTHSCAWRRRRVGTARSLQSASGDTTLQPGCHMHAC